MSEKTEVLFNGDCPICRREVQHYAKLSDQSQLPITYDDLSNPERLLAWGVTADEAAKRFHVRREGRVLSGLPAFIVLWREIPQTRWLARLLDLPILHFIASKGYDHIAAPMLYALHRRRMARRVRQGEQVKDERKAL